MRYWKGINSKNTSFGTMADDGSVPDGIECSKIEYENYVASLLPTKDFKDLFSKAATANDKIQLIAEKVGLL